MLLVPPTPLLITNIEAPQSGPIVTVTVTANIVAAVDHYEWYADGEYVGPTVQPQWGQPVDLNSVVEVVCIATRYADYDPLANEPRSYPAEITIEWNTAEDDSDVDYYRIDRATGESPGAYTEIGRKPRTGAWTYTFRTAPLTDLIWHWLRVTPVGLNGNDGTALLFTPTTQHVRRPDAPDLDTAFDDDTQKLTWSAA